MSTYTGLVKSADCKAYLAAGNKVATSAVMHLAHAEEAKQQHEAVHGIYSQWIERCRGDEAMSSLMDQMAKFMRDREAVIASCRSAAEKCEDYQVILPGKQAEAAARLAPFTSEDS